LSSPFTNWSDRVSPDATAPLAFYDNAGDEGMSYNGDMYTTVFIAYPFDAISQAAGRIAVTDRLLSFFGECWIQDGWLTGCVTDATTGDPLEGAEVTAAPGINGVRIQAITDTTSYYTMTLPADIYPVTVSAHGYMPAAEGGVEIISGTTTMQDFALETSCDPILNLDFTWLPLEPLNGDLITFTTSAAGSDPIDFQWSFGDACTGTGSTVTHMYSDAGVYYVIVSASNACGTQYINKTISILQRLLNFFLPLVIK
jgi:hypothetical protein